MYGKFLIVTSAIESFCQVDIIVEVHVVLQQSGTASLRRILIWTERQVLRRSQLAALGGGFLMDRIESTHLLRQDAAWPVGGTVVSPAGPGHMMGDGNSRRWVRIIHSILGHTEWRGCTCVDWGGGIGFILLKDSELSEGKAASHLTSYSELLSWLQLRRSLIKCVERIKKQTGMNE